MKEEKKYPFIMMEIWTDQDKRSETYREKYITVSCVPFKDGRADSDQIKLSKGNLQVFRSQDFEGLGEE